MVIKNLIKLSEDYVYFYVEAVFIIMSTIFDSSNWVSRQMSEYPIIIVSSLLMILLIALLFPIFIVTALITFVYLVYNTFYNEEDIIF